MVTSAQAEYVMSLVTERHGVVVQKLENLVKAISSADHEATLAANDLLIQSLEQMKAVLASQHWPSWLTELLAKCNLYKTRHSNGEATWTAHLKSIIDNYDDAKTENWQFEDQSKLLFDIDKLMRDALKEYGVDETFDKIVGILDAIIKSGEIDSIRAEEDLIRTKNNLIEAKNGSFTSRVVNWNFARRFIPNLIAIYIKKNKITGPLIEAFEQTAEELDVGLSGAKDKMGQAILAATADILRTKPNLQLTSNEVLMLVEHPKKPGTG